MYTLLFAGVFFVFVLQPRAVLPLKFKVISASSLPARIIAFPFREIKKMLFYHRTYAEYLRLRAEVNTLRARLVGMEEIVRENTRLDKLLAFKRELVYSSVAANVVGRDPSNWNATLVIDKGGEDGVQVGMPVVSAQGVVGKIGEISDQQSKVILLTDPAFSVSALVKRSRETGLVSGTLQGLSRMKYLPAAADVVIGDQVITSKLSPSFPEGLLIGEVVSVRSRGTDPVVTCIIQPAVPLSQVEEVLVIQKQ